MPQKEEYSPRTVPRKSSGIEDGSPRGQMYMQILTSKDLDTSLASSPRGSSHVDREGSAGACLAHMKQGFTFGPSMGGASYGWPGATQHGSQPRWNIFSKANEFGATEQAFSTKMSHISNLLQNYAGASGMKNEFAQMLYSSATKFLATSNSSQFLDNNHRLTKESKDKLNQLVSGQLLELVSNKEQAAKIEKSRLEHFDITGSINDAMGSTHNEGTVMLTLQNQQSNADCFSNAASTHMAVANANSRLNRTSSASLQS